MLTGRAFSEHLVFATSRAKIGTGLEIPGLCRHLLLLLVKILMLLKLKKFLKWQLNSLSVFVLSIFVLRVQLYAVKFYFLYYMVLLVSLFSVGIPSRSMWRHLYRRRGLDGEVHSSPNSGGIRGGRFFRSQTHARKLERSRSPH